LYLLFMPQQKPQYLNMFQTQIFVLSTSQLLFTKLHTSVFSTLHCVWWITFKNP